MTRTRYIFGILGLAAAIFSLVFTAGPALSGAVLGSMGLTLAILNKMDYECRLRKMLDSIEDTSDLIEGMIDHDRTRLDALEAWQRDATRGSQ